MQEYIKKIAQKYSDPQTSEMGYRTDFENFLGTIFPKEQRYRIHHDAKAVKGNKPDFIVLKDKVPLLYIENKDIGIDLDKIEKSNQIDRYFGYDNLILTDQTEFRFYRNGQRYGEPIKIATYDKSSRTISSLPENFQTLEKTLIDFTLSHKEPIKHGKHLAQIMGGKAQRIRDNVYDMLISENEAYSDLVKMKEVVRENLVSSLDDESFADMYAQTLVYGLFAARYNDESPETFSRVEARELVPKTNPFLRSFFDHIAGTTFPERLRFIVDELCEAFSHADVHKLLTDFYGEEKESKDPIIHFYEDFLKEYDAKKKMDMGVFYTPRPVVQFIVRAVDSLLKSEFGLAKGLTDTTKISIDKKEIDPKTGKEKNIQKEFHKVQVLDVATGTGTFLNEVIHHIHKDFIGQEGRWDAYVKSDLLPRLHGFELMMASYTIAHLKLGMTLQDFGAKNLNERLGVYLTNTLEAPVDYANQNTLFGIMDSIADEAKSASRVKSEYPIMCVIGNPPYAISSSNKGEWIQEKIEDYKKGLNEKKINIDDDYIKFIRFAQYMVDKNQEGVVAYISNNSFVDGITHRKMRESLLRSFDSIYILDLHGNARKKETAPDGGKDQNVFDIMQGVSINIFVKTNKKKDNELGKVYHADLYGERKVKYNFLDDSDFGQVKWNELKYSGPYYFFVPKDFESSSEYEEGFQVTDLFKIYSAGIKTKVDNVATDFNKETLSERVRDIIESKYSLKEVISKFDLSQKTTWEYNKVLEIKDFDPLKIVSFSYRPLDTRYIYFDHNFLSRSRKKVMEHISQNNFALSFIHQGKNKGLEVLISDSITCEDFITNHTFTAPLFLVVSNEKVPNLNKEIWDKINEIVGETTPENILDYIYALLHSPTYREKYKEFFKIDFPRVPYPESKEKFYALAKLGEKLRGLHLMTDPEVHNLITTFTEVGSSGIERIKFEKHLKAHKKISGQKVNLERDEIGDVWINDDQYFGNVPEVVWDFYIGGYQPAQKYLKDRKGRKLSNEEIEHYQKIVKVLSETTKIINQIGEIS